MMKNTALTSILILALTSFSSLALAKDTKKTLVREPDESTATYNRAPAKYGLGLASVTNLTGTSTALSGTIQFNREDLFQGFFAIGGTNGLFQVGFGGLYKHTVIESDGTGIHLGGGLGIGNIPKVASAAATANPTGSQLAFSLAAIAGIHVTLPQLPHIKLSVDGGPTLILSDNSTDFVVMGLSPALGFSIIYAF